VEWRPISCGARLPARAGQSSMSMLTSTTLGQSVCRSVSLSSSAFPCFCRPLSGLQTRVLSTYLYTTRFPIAPSLRYPSQTTTPLFRIPAPERDAPPGLGRKLPLSPQYQHRPRAVCREDSGLLDHPGIAPWPRRSNTVFSATLLAAISFA
jgi:hypothetical protein